jgi:Flp pilus assembly pilin Flp
MMKRTGSTNHGRHERRPGRIGRLLRDEQGATALEWVLLLVTIALPAYFIIRLALTVLTDHYRMMTTINGLPFP